MKEQIPQKNTRIHELSKLCRKYHKIALEIGFEKEYYKFLGLKTDNQIQKFEEMVKNKSDFAYSNQATSIKIKIDKLMQIEKELFSRTGNKPIEWKFARLNKEYKIPENYKSSLSHDSILIFSYNIKGTMFGTLYIFKILEEPESSISLTENEFMYFN